MRRYKEKGKTEKKKSCWRIPVKKINNDEKRINERKKKKKDKNLRKKNMKEGSIRGTIRK